MISWPISVCCTLSTLSGHKAMTPTAAEARALADQIMGEGAFAYSEIEKLTIWQYGQIASALRHLASLLEAREDAREKALEARPATAQNPAERHYDRGWPRPSRGASGRRRMMSDARRQKLNEADERMKALHAEWLDLEYIGNAS